MSGGVSMRCEKRASGETDRRRKRRENSHLLLCFGSLSNLQTAEGSGTPGLSYNTRSLTHNCAEASPIFPFFLCFPVFFPVLMTQSGIMKRLRGDWWKLGPSLRAGGDWKGLVWWWWWWGAVK